MDLRLGRTIMGLNCHPENAMLCLISSSYYCVGHMSIQVNKHVLSFHDGPGTMLSTEDTNTEK